MHDYKGMAMFILTESFPEPINAIVVVRVEEHKQIRPFHKEKRCRVDLLFTFIRQPGQHHTIKGLSCSGTGDIMVAFGGDERCLRYVLTNQRFDIAELSLLKRLTAAQAFREISTLDNHLYAAITGFYRRLNSFQKAGSKFFRIFHVSFYLPDIIRLIGMYPVEIMMTSFVEVYVTEIHE